MSISLMVLPAAEPDKIRVVSIPADMDQHEAFRHATGVIASVEEHNPECKWCEIEDALEEHGFETVGFLLGPSID
ncbi:MAG: hypothetical protein GY696_28765 [Gammaproteobacteria bacterium]|nr:hypothetical protein [Gammaproteobacteria bacterium]